MKEFYKEELEKLKEEYRAAADKETRRKLDLVTLIEKFERLVKYSGERG